MVTRTAYEDALHLLGFRPRTAAELRRALLRRGAPAADVDAAIQKLRDQKLIDDDQFARQFARVRALGRGASRRRIVQELGRKGIARAVADRAMEQLREEDGIDPSAGIHRIAKKKWASLGKLDDLTRRRRLYAFLARRGFDPDEIKAAMQALGEDADG